MFRIKSANFHSQGVTEIWTGIKKENGLWQANGKVVNNFQANWAPGEPRNLIGADCAFISKTAGYTMKTENCKTPKKFMCMALTPNCPPGYTWQPSFGQGRTCFKVTGPHTNEFNTANKLCLKDKTRLSTPRNLNDTKAIEKWLKAAQFPPGNKDYTLGILKDVTENKYLLLDRCFINFTQRKLYAD